MPLLLVLFPSAFGVKLADESVDRLAVFFAVPISVFAPLGVAVTNVSG